MAGGPIVMVSEWRRVGGKGRERMGYSDRDVSIEMR